MSRPPPASLLHPPPLVALEGGADGDVLEELVSADEVHCERQVVGSHPLKLCGAEAGAAFQLLDASLLEGACGDEEDRSTTVLKQVVNIIDFPL